MLSNLMPSLTQLSPQSLLGGDTHDLHNGLFREFMAKHGKSYANEAEHRRRFRIFRANLRKIQALQDTEQGTARYGITQFADLTSKFTHISSCQNVVFDELPNHVVRALTFITIPQSKNSNNGTWVYVQN
jgi:hypothetical protein